jgi:carbon starvation protein
MIALYFVGGCLVLLLGYRFYGRFLERQFDVDPSRPVPSETMKDGVDYVAAKTPVLFGHHFSSIAGAGPIVGPITAALAFGWLPPFLWLLVGAIFIGGTHDFAALMTSIRHKARSIGEICRIYLSPTTYKLFLGFVWLALVYVLVVFLDLTASTFAPAVGAVADEAKKAALVHTGGTVATASLIYIGLALAFGLIVNTGRINLKAGSAIFVPLVFIALVVAQYVPITVPSLIAGSPKGTWSIILLAYCFVASILPVWILLQPRDYLSSFLLYACVLVGGAGLIMSGLTGRLTISYPAFTGFYDSGLGCMFPAMFIVIACGAISGFHSIVASGTTAKQLPSEGAARPVAYGAMITEAVVGLVALAGIMMLAEKPVGGTPTAIFSQGMGRFLSIFGIPAGLGAGFGLLAISTFLLTTLDTCTRLARYIFEEMFGVGGRMRYLSTALTLALPLAIVFVKIPDPANPGACLPAWQAVWPVFGATNQLLAAMALLVVFVWRSHLRKAKWFVAWPMVLMFAITGTGLVQLLRSAVCSGQHLIASLSGVLMVMALALLIDTARSWKKITSAKIAEEDSTVPAVTS